MEPEIVFQLVSMPPSQRELIEILRAATRGVGDLILRLTLGADEQHAAAARDSVGDDLQRLMQQRHRLGEVDDVDVVARAEDEGAIFGFQRCDWWPK